MMGDDFMNEVGFAQQNSEGEIRPNHIFMRFWTTPQSLKFADANLVAAPLTRGAKGMTFLTSSKGLAFANPFLSISVIEHSG